jgi:hypothetical protein
MNEVLVQQEELISFFCPGCKDIHYFNVGKDLNPYWEWNNDLIKPTVSPSLLITGVKKMTDDEYNVYLQKSILPEPVPMTCHSFIRDGNIEFLNDCTHELAGKTIPLNKFTI